MKTNIACKKGAAFISALFLTLALALPARADGPYLAAEHIGAATLLAPPPRA